MTKPAERLREMDARDTPAHAEVEMRDAAALLDECERVLAFYASAQVATPTPGATWQNCDDGRYASATLAKLRGEEASPIAEAGA